MSAFPLFAQPPAEFRPMPFYVWNTDGTEQMITEDIEWFAARGYGGMFVHPRGGLITEYLSPRWFELWRHALAECKRLGMSCHIYDENSYPSGFGGGHTMSRNPHTALQLLSGRWVINSDDRLDSRSGTRLASFRRDEQGGMVPVQPGEKASLERPFFAVEMLRAAASNWSAGYSYVDLCRPETTEEFLAATHERYAAEFGPDLGGAIRYAFADEPEVTRGGALNFSRFLQREFRVEHGYELTDHLAALCFGGANAFAVRHDYLRTVNRLFVTHYAKRCHDWCEAHGLRFTGHFMEHFWPVPSGSPSNMAVLRWMQAPGSDLLAFQFTPESLAANALYLMNLKEVASVARQAGHERVLCETNGGGGYDWNVRPTKLLEDFAMALGVNLVNPHLFMQTTVGARKYDWAQTFSPHAPWAETLDAHTDHVGRTVYAMLQTVERNRVLVLHPTTTGWLHYRAKAFHLPGEDADAPLQRLRAAQTGLCADLYAAQVDYDLGDEFVLAEMGDVQDGALRCGEGRYELLVIPPLTETLLTSTVALIERWLAAGGRVISATELPAHVEGRPNAAVADLAARFPSQWRQLPAPGDFVPAVVGAVPPRLAGLAGAPLAWRVQHHADGSRLVFVANTFSTPFSGTLRTAGGSVQELDTTRGVVAPARGVVKDGADVTLGLALAPGEHRLLLVRDEQAAALPAEPTVATTPVAWHLESITRAEPNVLCLDYCDCESPGVRIEDAPTIVADGANWIAQGFDHNPWQFSIQFRRTVVERPLPPDSWVRVTYRWELDAKLVGVPLELAIERPEGFSTIAVNGTPIGDRAGGTWFDRQMRTFAIGDLTVAGTNTLTLEARPFHAHAEIAPVLVRGEFAAAPQARGFRLEEARPLRLGDWTAQGASFYAGRVRYRVTFELPAAAKALELVPGNWGGSALWCAVDGQAAGVRPEGTRQWRVEGPFAAGPHTLELTVAGNLRNQMGPHHGRALPHPSSWEYGKPHLPPGADYFRSASGLGEDFALRFEAA